MALRESESRLRLMAESIPDIFWLAVPNGGPTLYVSPAYEKISGRPTSEVYENPRAWLEIVHPEDLPRVRHGMTKRDARRPAADEFRIVRPDGSIRWIRDRIAPVLDDHAPHGLPVDRPDEVPGPGVVADLLEGRARPLLRGKGGR